MSARLPIRTGLETIDMRHRIRAALAALALSAGAPAGAAERLPILSGRWSSGDSTEASSAGSRWFAPGVTASANDRCRVTVERAAGRIFDNRLDCRYRAAADDRDAAVIEVETPSALRWIDRCSATRYRFCAGGPVPGLFSAACP